MRFKDKVAIVAGGGGKGIGAAIAVALAAEGAQVSVWDISEESAKETVTKIQANKGKAKAVKMDILDYAQVKTGVDQVVKDFGKLDIMVCAVGGGKFTPFKDYTPEFWKKQVYFNLDSAFNCAHAALAPMMQRSYGKMLFFTSATGGIPGLTGYEVAKAGIESLIKTMVAELPQSKLNINAIMPGFTDTPHTRSLFVGPEGEKKWQQRDTSMPLGINKPDNVAVIALFLLSDDAYRLTGQIVASL